MERNELWARIKEIAGKYDKDLDIAERVKLRDLINADIQKEAEYHEQQLATLKSALAGKKRVGRPHKTQPTGDAPRSGGRGRRKGKVRVTDGIITALANGPLDYDELKAKVDKLCGRDVGKLYPLIVILKKKGAITSPARGTYKLGKGR